MLFFGADSSRTRALRDREASSSLPRRRHHHDYPDALPCRDYYVRLPEEVGAVANVEIGSVAELRQWLLVARPVSAEEAERHGGCIKFTPRHIGEGCFPVQPLYFCLTDSDDVVYGRAHYTPLRTPATCGEYGSGECPDWTEDDALTGSGAISPCNDTDNGAQRQG